MTVTAHDSGGLAADQEFTVTLAPVATTRDGNPEIYVMNADGSDAERLTNNSGFDGQPAWSPDGTEIAFSAARSAAIHVAYIAVR